MRVEVRIDHLRALHAGEARAEPYIWPFFFKVDSHLFGEAAGRGRAGDPSFDAPGGEHGNLPPMQTGEMVAVDLGWSTTLVDGDDLLLHRHAVVGIGAVLFEEDLTPRDATVRKAYAAWTGTMENRIRAAVKRRVEAAVLGAPYSFAVRTDRDRAEALAFDPIALEAELTKKMPHVHRGLLLDADDFIGAMVWCASAAELVAVPHIEFKKLWTPTTGSEEGSWELFVSARQA